MNPRETFDGHSQKFFLFYKAQRAVKIAHEHDNILRIL
jgi:hypothetical protein